MSPKNIIDQWHMCNFSTAAYTKILQHYKLKPFHFDLPHSPTFSRRGLILGQENFDSWCEWAKRKRQVSVVEGFALSGPLHLGSLSSLMQVAYYQKHFNANVYLPLSDLEAIAVRRANPKIYDMVMRYLMHFEAAGIDTSKANIYVQARNPRVMRLMSEVIRNFNYKDFELVYGRKVTLEEIYGSLLTISDILLPYTYKMQKCLVPSGIDEINTFSLIKKLVRRMKLNNWSLAVTYSKTIPGINSPKMGKSVPEASILLNDTPQTVRDKFKRVKNRNLGLDRNPAFNILLWYSNSNKLIDSLKNMRKEEANRIATSSAIETTIALLNEHQRRYQKARKKAARLADLIAGR